MGSLLRRFSGERIIIVQSIASLLLLLVTTIVCLLRGSTPEENGVVSASICIAVVMFVAISSSLRKEGIEGLFFAIIGSFIAGLAASIVGARLAFDPEIGSYLLSSLTLSIFLSLGSVLYVMPEDAKERERNILILIGSTLMTILVNFAIIYWLPRLI